MLVKLLHEVPDSLFDPVVKEVNAIDWSGPNIVNRGNKVYQLQLRKPVDDTGTGYGTGCQCDDNPVFENQFSAVRELVSWIQNYVTGSPVGRVMITNLVARGSYPAHVDPGEYYEVYSRYHVPIITNPAVFFSGGARTRHEHMPVKWLSRLNNRLLHQVDNASGQNRIHIIADIADPGGNQIF